MSLVDVVIEIERRQRLLKIHTSKGVVTMTEAEAEALRGRMRAAVEAAKRERSNTRTRKPK